VQCSGDGLTEPIARTCTSAEYCDASATTCEPQICTPDAPACNAELATTCNSIGDGYTGGVTDCSLSTMVCFDGACRLAVTVDVVGSPGVAFSGPNRFRNNYYSASTSRTLVEIEAFLGLPGSTTLTWIVYESTTQNGTYSLIQESTTSVNPASATAIYYSSGSVSVPLVAGRFYAIGAGWGATTVMYYNGSSHPVVTAFGQSFVADLLDVFPAPATVPVGVSGNVYAHRLTTTGQ